MIFSIDAGDIVALIAVGIAVWSAMQTHRFNRRQTAFEETNERLNLVLLEKEAAESEANKRADLSANFYQAGKGKYRLKVFNRGLGVARNVRFECLDESCLLIQGDINRKFPVPILEQHQNVELIGAVTLGSPSRVHIRLTWDDATGQDHQKELHPSW